MFDEAKLTITCPGCGHQFQEKIARLKTNPKIPCARCGREITVKNEKLVRPLGQFGEAVKNFRRSIRRR